MNKYNKYFVIGLNKTATRSIHNLFIKNNYKALHWCISKDNYDGNKIEELVENNLNNNKNLLDNFLEENFQVFSDVQNLSINFHVLDKQYPNSLFIYNYRSLNSWVLSRLNFANGNYINFWKKYNNKEYLSELEIINIWIELYNSHKNKVYDYFKNKNNIIYYDIENETMLDFVNKLPLNLKYTEEIKEFVTVNKTWIFEDDKFKKIS